MDLVEIHAKAPSFKEILEKSKNHAVRCMEDSFGYSKDKWDKSHATPDFKLGDPVLVSTTKFNNIKGCKNLKDPFSRAFFIKALHGENSVQVELSEELSSSKALQHIPPVEPYDTKKSTKVLKETTLRTKKVREYPVRYSDPACEDK
ncbi:hypothetical protein O181_003459 [Austropuccinia psidii MF-1]|uniref:Uncharacterized protein n=1 Tax=Austropuccinia psidii MF-1 TaxID=1389203 RepID=A0A9Q3BEE5_9BASI|nr:hypothetical protein [Austropuccinia psidii MF-1]